MVPDWAGYCRFRDGFAQAMDPRYYPIEWLDEQVLQGGCRVFVGENAAITAEIKVYPSGTRAILGGYAAGDLGEVLKLIPLAEEWGRECGCTSAFIDSREAWERLLAPMGYAPYKFALRREI